MAPVPRLPALLAAAATASGSGCGDCWCVRNATAGERCPAPPPNYTAADIALFLAPAPARPIVLAGGCNPYRNASCRTDPPQPPAAAGAVCAVRYAAGCGSYDLRTFPSAAGAGAAGFAVTHLGTCGVCSTLQDLASYMIHTDMTGPGKKCGALAAVSVDAAAACFAETEGMSPECARLNAYDAHQDADGPCATLCLRDIAKPYNLPPDCRLNDCLQCDEDGPGPIFKRFSGRTRRDSGILSAIQRPCAAVHPVEHAPCRPPSGAAESPDTVAAAKSDTS